MAYADYRDLMDLTEEMLSSIAQDLLGDTKLPYGEHSIDFGGPYARMSMLEAIQHYNPDNATIQAMTYEEVKDLEFMRKLAKDVGLEIESFWTCGQLLEEIFGETAEPKLMQPTFITGYPADISPLARRNDDNDLSLTASSSSSVVVKWPTASASSMTPKIRTTASRLRLKPRMPVTTKPCSMMPTILRRWSTACHRQPVRA